MLLPFLKCPLGIPKGDAWHLKKRLFESSDRPLWVNCNIITKIKLYLPKQPVQEAHKEVRAKAEDGAASQKADDDEDDETSTATAL